MYRAASVVDTNANDTEHFNELDITCTFISPIKLMCIVVCCLVTNLFIFTFFFTDLWDIEEETTVSRRTALVTMVSSADYVAGALLLLYTWNKYTPKHLNISTHALVVPENIPQNALQTLECMGWILHNVSAVTKKSQKKQRVAINFTKLKLWSAETNLTEFDQLLYIDSDAMLIGPMYKLFNKKYLPFSAVMSTNKFFNTGVFTYKADNKVLLNSASCITN